MKIDDILQTKFNSPQQRAIINIRFTSNFLGNIQQHKMNQYDLSMPQFNILRILRGAGDAINVNSVKDKMLEKSPNTTRLMDKLIEKKLIERTRCEEDRRVVFVKISQFGLSVLSEIDKNADITLLINASLTDEEANTLSDLLDKTRSTYE